MKTKNGLLMIPVAMALLMAQSAFSDGGATSGGGSGVAAHYSEVAKKALNAVKIICRGAESPESKTIAACSHIAPLELAIDSMKVEPRSRNTILGPDGQPRDAGNDGSQTVFLDVDRWADKQNESDPTKTTVDRTMQVKIALHEPLVLAGAETNDQYLFSDKLVDLLDKNNFDFNRLVGKPKAPTASLIYKIFTQTDFTSSYSPVEAAVEAAALSEGFDHCVIIREWAEHFPGEVYFPDTLKYSVQMKCSKPTNSSDLSAKDFDLNRKIASALSQNDRHEGPGVAGNAKKTLSEPVALVEPVSLPSSSARAK